MSEPSERNPGITSPLIPAPALAGEEPLRVLIESKFIASLQGAEKLSDLIQWRDLRSLTPGYFLQQLRGLVEQRNPTVELTRLRVSKHPPPQQVKKRFVMPHLD